jgi:hypothetical protein
VTLRNYANKRDAAEPAIVKALQAAGCSVVRMDKPVDLLIGYRGCTYLCEVKTGKGKYTEDQKQFFAAWRGSSIPILRTVDDVLAALKSWSVKEAA